MTLRTLLVLGRVSNLPTVWSNVLAALILCGAGDALGGVEVLALCVLLSAFYLGGMVLNDVFDVDYDHQHRPQRPIPSGQISTHGALALGASLLVVGVVGLVTYAWWSVRTAPALVALSGSMLAALIVTYDLRHKGNPAGPLLMALCRFGVYAVVGVSVGGELWGPLGIGALGLLSYIVGLTYAAKQEDLRTFGSRWPLLFLIPPLVVPWLLARGTEAIFLLAPVWFVFAGWLFRAYLLLAPVRGEARVGVAVGRMIAAVSLVDAALVAGQGRWLEAALAVACFLLTLAAHRWVPGT